MGQVDGEAGIAPGRAQTDLLRLHQDHLVVRELQRQLPRGSETGETGADHHPGRLAMTAMAGPGRARGTGVVPATGVVVGGQGLDFHGAQPSLVKHLA